MFNCSEALIATAKEELRQIEACIGKETWGGKSATSYQPVTVALPLCTQLPYCMDLRPEEYLSVQCSSGRPDPGPPIS